MQRPRWHSGSLQRQAPAALSSLGPYFCWQTEGYWNNIYQACFWAECLSLPSSKPRCQSTLVGLCYQPGVASLPTVIYMKECCFAISPWLILKLRQGSTPITTYHAGGGGGRATFTGSHHELTQNTLKSLFWQIERIFPPFKASGRVCWAHNVAWLSWPLTESGPTAGVRGTLPLGMQSHLFHNRNIRKVGGKDSAWSLWGHTPETPPIHECLDSENRKRRLHFHSKVRLRWA